MLSYFLFKIERKNGNKYEAILQKCVKLRSRLDQENLEISREIMKLKIIL